MGRQFFRFRVGSAAAGFVSSYFFIKLFLWEKNCYLSYLQEPENVACGLQL